jgi:inner membrane protein involved in colicin E2 resistance
MTILDDKFDIEILPDPKMVGASEYHAIWEVLENAETIEQALNICDEFKTHAAALRDRIRKMGARNG